MRGALSSLLRVCRFIGSLLVAAAIRLLESSLANQNTMAGRGEQQGPVREGKEKDRILFRRSSPKGRCDIDTQRKGRIDQKSGSLVVRNEHGLRSECRIKKRFRDELPLLNLHPRPRKRPCLLKKAAWRFILSSPEDVEDGVKTATNQSSVLVSQTETLATDSYVPGAQAGNSVVGTGLVEDDSPDAPPATGDLLLPDNPKNSQRNGRAIKIQVDKMSISYGDRSGVSGIWDNGFSVLKNGENMKLNSTQRLRYNNRITTLFPGWPLVVPYLKARPRRASHNTHNNNKRSWALAAIIALGGA
ncbi:unnamed protein product [Linum trigynum]|uniref:Uncharacterized protein n=1 Tax=Linum trigynum TaxID=586398 RepID=A0AAV2E7M4_9ROSI